MVCDIVCKSIIFDMSLKVIGCFVELCRSVLVYHPSRSRYRLLWDLWDNDLGEVSLPSLLYHLLNNVLVQNILKYLDILLMWFELLLVLRHPECAGCKTLKLVVPLFTLLTCSVVVNFCGEELYFFDYVRVWVLILELP